jgi:exosortase
VKSEQILIPEPVTDAKPDVPFREEVQQVWRQIPYKHLFFALLIPWLALFHFLGNSTFGYVETPSLFGWMKYVMTTSLDDEHGLIMPFVVLGLMWWKRKILLEVPKRHWWPALALIALGLVLHLLGYMVQQTRISIVGLFGGIYGIMGLVWGPQWLRATFFPFFLFVFCVPVGTMSETLTFPLRLLATDITVFLSKNVLGIPVLQDGTRIFDANGSFQYEVAAACSGLRSLTATLALATIYGFVTFKRTWRAVFMVSLAFPLAVVANVFRLTMIIVAAEAFGQSAGNFVHENSILSLLPYVPAIGGILVIGYLLRETKETMVQPLKNA